MVSSAGHRKKLRFSEAGRAGSWGVSCLSLPQPVPEAGVGRGPGAPTQVPDPLRQGRPGSSLDLQVPSQPCWRRCSGWG